MPKSPNAVKNSGAATYLPSANQALYEQLSRAKQREVIKYQMLENTIGVDEFKMSGDGTFTASRGFSSKPAEELALLQKRVEQTLTEEGYRFTFEGSDIKRITGKAFTSGDVLYTFKIRGTK